MKPNNFPLRPTLDGSEEIYTQTSGVSEKFTLEQAKGYIRPYKVYTALLTQSGINPPVATVLENTIGNIVWSYENLGVYSANLISGFPTDKTIVNILNVVKNASDSPNICSWAINDSTDSKIIIQTESANFDDILYNTPIEIRVYN